MRAHTHGNGVATGMHGDYRHPWDRHRARTHTRTAGCTRSTMNGHTLESLMCGPACIMHAPSSSNGGPPRRAGRRMPTVSRCAADGGTPALAPIEGKASGGCIRQVEEAIPRWVRPHRCAGSGPAARPPCVPMVGKPHLVCSSAPEPHHMSYGHAQ